MLIVIEGTDGSGKTTLADELERRLLGTRHAKLVRRHFGPPEQHPLWEYERWLDFYRPGHGTHVILDRFHWGEMIYSELYRGGSRLGEAGWWHIEQYLRSRGALMVHATGDPVKIADRQVALGEDFLQVKDATNVWESFRAIAKASILPVETYDSTMQHVEDMAEIAISFAAYLENEVSPLESFPSYIGPLDPELLIVGDQPNDNPGESFQHEAAFPPYPSTSGRFLVEALLSSRSGLGEIGMCNAYHHGAVPIALDRLWTKLGEPPVVALGRRAEHHLNICRVPHREVPHPQWQRRFSHAQKREYGQLILGDIA
jgi:thymidylate kinase